MPKNVDFKIIDHFEKVTDKDAAILTRKLAREEGVFGGYSSGAAISGVIQLKNQLFPYSGMERIRPGEKLPTVHIFIM